MLLATSSWFSSLYCPIHGPSLFVSATDSDRYVLCDFLWFRQCASHLGMRSYQIQFSRCTIVRCQIPSLAGIHAFYCYTECIAIGELAILQKIHCLCTWLLADVRIDRKDSIRIRQWTYCANVIDPKSVREMRIFRRTFRFFCTVLLNWFTPTIEQAFHFSNRARNLSRSVSGPNFVTPVGKLQRDF